MIRFLTLLALSATVVAAFALYSYKHDTRRLEMRVSGLEVLIEQAGSDIAVLRAELGHLARPDRLGKLAREHLGFAPVRGDQFGTLASIPTRQDAQLHASAGSFDATGADLAPGQRAGDSKPASQTSVNQTSASPGPDPLVQDQPQ